MPVADDLVGQRSEPFERSWTSDSVMSYAIAVGAGAKDPLDELAFTTENSAGHHLTVLPTFGNILIRGAQIPLGDVNPAKVVHAEQSFVNHRPIPTEGHVTTLTTVVGVEDKGSGAIVRFEAVARTDDGEPLVTANYSYFLIGEGGFGGASSPASLWTEPADEATTVIETGTRPEQALLYRLTGDHNRLHTDPVFARAGGLDAPILHGMCSYGFAGRLLFSTFAESNPNRFGRMSGRFTTSIRPGAPLKLFAWNRHDHIQFRLCSGNATVIDRGVLELVS